jgi:hypothetical protein
MYRKDALLQFVPYSADTQMTLPMTKGALSAAGDDCLLRR